MKLFEWYKLQASHINMSNQAIQDDKFYDGDEMA